LGDFDKKCVGPHFGRFFHKLIWSPCSPVTHLLNQGDQIWRVFAYLEIVYFS
jgi:hypothetical protein